MKKEEIIQLINHHRELYSNEADLARRRMHRELNCMTAQQIQQEITFIQDMESRAYEMKLLLEEIFGE